MYRGQLKQCPSKLVDLERWGVTEPVCAVELFIRTGSVIEIQQGFRHEMNRHESPSSNEICRWVGQWREKGSVACNKPPDWPFQLAHPAVCVCRPQSEAICK